MPSLRFSPDVPGPRKARGLVKLSLGSPSSASSVNSALSTEASGQRTPKCLYRRAIVARVSLLPQW
eukprot:6872291-Karenia_brevis.AAC.1